MKRTIELSKPSLVRALGHPLRARILGILQERRASPRELAEELRVPLGNVAYHVGKLADLKLIKLVKQTPRRGAVEHYYEATAATVIRNSAWSEAPGLVRKAVAASTLEEIGRSVTQAAFGGGFERSDAQLSRTRLVLDARGWSELAEAIAKFIERAGQVAAQSETRLERADHDGELQASLVMMLFESELSR